ncbi:MAG: 4Fe-4S dicluster domain-containing protein [Dehalococcoidales bacterium]|nr:4Fe-4S dicluster domain-containing protein [Dehalococcoidales bacterium]
MPRYGLIFDLERCIGCRACTVACKVENNIEHGSWMQVQMADGQKVDTAKGKFPDVKLNYLPTTCMHCQKPACVDACPVGAIFKRNDGVVILDSTQCTGCEACLSACPYGVITFNEKDNVASKCNLCAHRIDQGLQPFCVQCCEGQAMQFADLSNIGSEVSKSISRRGGYNLKPEEMTEPTNYYLPPLPKRPV